MTRIRSRLNPGGPEFPIPGGGIPQIQIKPGGLGPLQANFPVGGGAPAPAAPAQLGPMQPGMMPGWGWTMPVAPVGGFVRTGAGGDWIPAVSNLNAGLAANLPVFVLDQGDGTGTLYTSGTAPKLVTITASEPGGPTGMQVMIDMGLPASSNPVDYGGDQLVAETDAPGMCCYDAEAGVLRCDDGSTQGADLLKQIADQGGNPLFIVQTQDGTQQTVPACTTTPPGGGGGGGGTDGGGGRCCYDKAMSILVCDPGDPRDGQSVAIVAPITAQDGTPLVIVRLPDGSQITATVCESPPGMCCYDVATGTLRCPKNPGLNGQQVSLVAMTQQPDGSILAIVQIQGQEAIATYPICDDHVSECCYDGATQKIVCGDPSLSGTDAAVVASWTDGDGQVWVWAAWAGGGARMPLCPGTKCPPSLCCVNVETMRYVCPGQIEMNGQPAQVANIVTEDGFNWGVLADGSRVPLCGRDCPPPEMCPQCPTCPPDLWMSPDGQCVPPPQCLPPGNCPPCPNCPPPGGGRPCPPYPGTPDAMIRAANPMARQGVKRVRGKPVSRKKNPCCDDCRKGNPCSGCGKRNPMTEQISFVYGQSPIRRVSRRWRTAL
jgi:hypothetical protein